MKRGAPVAPFAPRHALPLSSRKLARTRGAAAPRPRLHSALEVRGRLPLGQGRSRLPARIAIISTIERVASRHREAMR